MTLISRLSEKEDTITGKIEQKLGVPQRQKPILFRMETVTNTTGTITSTFTDLLVQHPYVSKVDNRLVGLTFSEVGAGIVVTKNDLKVELGRVPSINKFLEGAIAYLGAAKTSKRIDAYINPVMSGSTLISYDFRASILNVLDEDLTRWVLILRLDKD